MDVKFDVDSNGLLHITQYAEKAAVHKNNVNKISEMVADYFDTEGTFNSDDDFYAFLEMKGDALLDIVHENTNETAVFFKSLCTVKYGYILFQLIAKNGRPAVQLSFIHEGSILSYALVARTTTACLDLLKHITLSKALDLVEEAIHFNNQATRNME